MKYRILIVICLSICSVLKVTGQNQQKLESLWNAFKQAKHDTTRIKTYLNIGDIYEYEKPDTALLFYQKAADLADKAIGSTPTTAPKNAENRLFSLKANCMQYIGLVHKDQGSYDKAIEYYLKSLKIFEELLERSGNPDSEAYREAQKGMSMCYNNIGNVHWNQGSYDQAIAYYLKALKIYEELLERSGNPDSEAYREAQKGMSQCYNNIGNVLADQGSYDHAIAYYLKSLKIKEESGDKKGMSKCYNNIGLVHKDQGSYDKALEYYLKSLKIEEELLERSGNPDSEAYREAQKGMSQCYNNIGLVHKDQGSYDKALEYYLKSLKIFEELDAKKGMSACYTNIGNVHRKQGSSQLDKKIQRDKYDQAISYFLKSLKIDEESGDKKGMSACYNNIGNVHSAQGSYDQAIAYFLKSLKIKEELGDNKGVAIVYGNIALLHIDLADSTALTENQKINYLNSAVDYGLKSLNLAKEIGAVPTQNDAAANLQKAYTKLGKYKEAIKYAEIFITTQDSMFSEEKTKALAEMGAKYEAEKKQLQIDNLNKENALKKAELAQSEEKRSKQLILIYSFVAGFIIILVFSIVIFRLFVQKKKANVLLKEQKHQIEMQNVKLNQANEEISAQRDEITAQRDLVTGQKEHIEEQKKEIDDSIHYAKRIQNAVLPSVKYADSILGEHFIIFRPHSVVSGDFYWAAQTEEWTVVTAADCTGHGVPGAFMSMLGVSFLNEIVRKKDVTNTADVLNHLRTSVIDALKQTGEEGTQNTSTTLSVKDGMDMSIVAIHKTRKHAVWAGANNPLWIIKQSTLNNKHEEITDIVEEVLALRFVEVKADKMPVAVHIKMDNFTNHEIQLETGDRLYLFSDGLPDQFGGPGGRKFMYKQFKTILAETTNLTMKEQGEKLEQELDKWMAGYGTKYEQVDDITVVGLKI